MTRKATATTTTTASRTTATTHDGRTTRRWALGGALLGVLTLVAPSGALAGSRILCDVVEIGEARSLPWRSGKGWHLPSSDYPPQRLVPDTLALLTPTMPVLVRIETLRRATIYARSFTGTNVGRELAWRLMARAVEAEARGKPDALALFDAGYFAESLEQWDEDWVRQVDGYALVQRATALRPDDAEIELGAMFVAGQNPRRPGPHFQKVSAAARKHPQLARNLAVLYPEAGGR